MTQKQPETAPPEESAAAPKEQSAKKPRNPSAKDAKIAALEAKLTEGGKEAAGLKDSLLRTAAEYDNYRRRATQEKQAAFGNGVAHAALQLLPVLDTLEAAAAAPTADEDYKKGVLLTLQKCGEVFTRLGIEEIEALAKPFDPELHDACMNEAAEGFESGSVTRVVRKGYMQNGKVVRHAVVAVCP